MRPFVSNEGPGGTRLSKGIRIALAKQYNKAKGILPSTDIEYKAEQLAQYRETLFTTLMFDHLVGATCTNEEQDEEISEYTYRLKFLHNQLLGRMYELIEEHATEHQKKILWLWLHGKNLKVISQVLEINRTGAFHAMYGIPRPTTDGSRLVHGGLTQKFRAIADEDPECKSLWIQIKELKKAYDFSDHFFFVKNP